MRVSGELQDRFRCCWHTEVQRMSCWAGEINAMKLLTQPQLVLERVTLGVY